MRLTTERVKTVNVPGDPDGGYVNIRLLSVDERARIESNTSKVDIVNNGFTVNVYQRDNGVASACLKGWGNMYDAQGKELKFNNNNLAKLGQLSIDVDDKKIRFLKWIADEHDKFVEEVEAESKEAAKN